MPLTDGESPDVRVNLSGPTTEGERSPRRPVHQRAEGSRMAESTTTGAGEVRERFEDRHIGPDAPEQSVML